MDATESKKVPLSSVCTESFYFRCLFFSYVRHRCVYLRSASLRVPNRPDARDGPGGAGAAAGARHGEPVPRAARTARRSALLEPGARARLLRRAHSASIAFGVDSN